MNIVHPRGGRNADISGKHQKHMTYPKNLWATWRPLRYIACVAVVIFIVSNTVCAFMSGARLLGLCDVLLFIPFIKLADVWLADQKEDPKDVG